MPISDSFEYRLNGAFGLLSEEPGLIMIEANSSDPQATTDAGKVKKGANRKNPRVKYDPEEESD